MTDYQVTCHRPDNADADRRLQGLGGPAAGGWYRDIDILINLIESRQDRFWTSDSAGNTVWIIVASRNRRKYLRA